MTCTITGDINNKSTWNYPYTLDICRNREVIPAMGLEGGGGGEGEGRGCKGGMHFRVV